MRQWTDGERREGEREREKITYSRKIDMVIRRKVIRLLVLAAWKKRQQLYMFFLCMSFEFITHTHTHTHSLTATHAIS